MTVPRSTVLQVFRLPWKALIYVLSCHYFMYNRKIHNLGLFLPPSPPPKLVVHVCLKELSLIILIQMNDMDIVI